MTVAVFVDTNVLVYGRDASERVKQPLAWAWREQLWRRQAGRLSTQVLQEFYVTVTRKLRPGLPRELARREVADLSLWRPVEASPELLEAAFEVEDRHRLSFWDALVVAAAQAARCDFLLSEDLKPDSVLGGVRVINPFATSPEEVLDRA
jgi:predicted nucleic acid-binding protein